MILMQAFEEHGVLPGNQFPSLQGSIHCYVCLTVLPLEIDHTLNMSKCSQGDGLTLDS